jgi:alkyl sulfatase BDS1-like metallo-beta-lactamase superfamily hydrolase
MVLTIRGAQVRDAHAWAHYLTETIALFADQIDVVFASHHRPTWGRERAVEFLAMQRAMYLYLHDQTLRLITRVPPARRSPSALAHDQARGLGEGGVVGEDLVLRLGG